MNRRGFTLVELLAVIIILLGISLIAVSGISASLERREERECENEKELAKNAAKIYFSLNSSTSVTVATLKSNGYFNENSNIDRLKDDGIIRINSNEYVYEGDCE